MYEASTACGKKVALKVTSVEDPQTARETAALKVLHKHPHDNVAGWIQKPFKTNSGNMCQLLELCQCDFMSFVEHFDGSLTESMCRIAMTQVLQGLSHCHSHGIYHLDIKPENILFSADKMFKLTDFGCAAVLVNENENENDRSTSPVPTCESPRAVAAEEPSTSCKPGTYLYASPETFENGPYLPEKIDVWAVGVCIFATLQGVYPWTTPTTSDINYVQYLHYCSDNRAADYFKHESVLPISDLLCDLLALMLHPSVSKRATLKDVRAHKWFF